MFGLQSFFLVVQRKSQVEASYVKKYKIPFWLESQIPEPCALDISDLQAAVSPTYPREVSGRGLSECGCVVCMEPAFVRCHWRDGSGNCHPGITPRKPH